MQAARQHNAPVQIVTGCLYILSAFVLMQFAAGVLSRWYLVGFAVGAMNLGVSILVGIWPAKAQRRVRVIGMPGREFLRK